MKNLIKFFVLFSFISGLYTSCQKDNFIESEFITKKIEQVKVLDNIETVNNPISIEEYTLNSIDTDDENINKQLLEIAIATREYFKGNIQNEAIMSKANLSSNKCFNLNELSSINSLKSANKEYLNLIAVISNASLKHRSTNPLKSGVVEEYVPAIHIVNLETADMNKQPLICPGFEVNSELEGLEDFEDYIVAWFYDENNNLNEILINEEMAMSTSHPVFVIDNAEEAEIYREQFTYNSSAPLKSTMSGTEYHSYEFKINERYEGSGDSEFCITAAQIDENGDVKLILRDNGYTSWKQISSVSKRNIGRLFSEWNQFCSDDVLPFESNFIFWNTYERDWYSSDKSLGQALRNNTTIYLSGKRKYSNEWYMYDPSELNNNPLDLNTIYYSWAKWHINTKTEFRIWRVEL